YSEFINDIKEIVKLAKEYKISIKSITGMQNGLGIPDINNLKELFDFCKQNEIPFQSVTGMQHGLGIPKIEKINQPFKNKGQEQI
ncbi:MAG: hypothetical protein RMK17_02655, partial [bacterium]|nr:hypothetical protein [bacterium]